MLILPKTLWPCDGLSEPHGQLVRVLWIFNYTAEKHHIDVQSDPPAHTDSNVIDVIMPQPQKAVALFENHLNGADAGWIPVQTSCKWNMQDSINCNHNHHHYIVWWFMVSIRQ